MKSSTRMTVAGVKSSFAAAPYAGPPQAASAWYTQELDDAAVCGNEGAEADLTRPLVVDEEALHKQHQQQHLQQQQQQQPSTSYQQEYLETIKLLASGGLAGAVSKSCTAPLARLTILFQARRAMGFS